MEQIRKNGGCIYIGIKRFGIIMNINNVKWNINLYCILLFEYLHML